MQETTHHKDESPQGFAKKGIAASTENGNLDGMKEGSKKKPKRWLFFVIIVLLVLLALAGWYVWAKFSVTSTGFTYTNSVSDIDTDGDGIIDTKEDELGTAIDSRDTDGDGYTDKEEVDNGFDPQTKPGEESTETTSN